VLVDDVDNILLFFVLRIDVVVRDACVNLQCNQSIHNLRHSGDLKQYKRNTNNPWREAKTEKMMSKGILM
jgi:hypothetical protein